MQVDCAAVARVAVADYDSRPRRGARALPLRALAAGSRARTTTMRSGDCGWRPRCSPGRADRGGARLRRGPDPRRDQLRSRRRAGGAGPRARRDRPRRGRAGARRRAARPRRRAAPGACGSRPSGRRSCTGPGWRWRGRASASWRSSARPRPTASRASCGAPAGLAARPARSRSSASRSSSGSGAPPPMARVPLTRREQEVVRLVAGRPHQPRDRRGALPQPAHGRHARAQHPRQARLPLPGRGQHQGRRGRAAGLSGGAAAHCLSMQFFFAPVAMPSSAATAAKPGCSPSSSGVMSVSRRKASSSSCRQST